MSFLPECACSETGEVEMYENPSLCNGAARNYGLGPETADGDGAVYQGNSGPDRR